MEPGRPRPAHNLACEETGKTLNSYIVMNMLALIAITWVGKKASPVSGSAL